MPIQMARDDLCGWWRFRAEERASNGVCAGGGRRQALAMGLRPARARALCCRAVGGQEAAGHAAARFVAVAREPRQQPGGWSCQRCGRRPAHGRRGSQRPFLQAWGEAELLAGRGGHARRAGAWGGLLAGPCAPAKQHKPVALREVRAHLPDHNAGARPAGPPATALHAGLFRRAVGIAPAWVHARVASLARRVGAAPVARLKRAVGADCACSSMRKGEVRPTAYVHLRPLPMRVPEAHGNAAERAIAEQGNRAS